MKNRKRRPSRQPRRRPNEITVYEITGANEPQSNFAISIPAAPITYSIEVEPFKLRRYCRAMTNREYREFASACHSLAAAELLN